MKHKDLFKTTLRCRIFGHRWLPLWDLGIVSKVCRRCGRFESYPTRYRSLVTGKEL